jgi:TetR/AcrR family transcriptional regulator
MPPTPATRRRRPGRPARPRSAVPPDEVRQRLLEAAEQLFAARGYDAVGVRELARAAHVSPAMIAYYFGDKAGLLDAVFDRVFERLLAQLRSLAEAPAGERGAPERLIRLYVETIGREPWLPSFVVREVLGGDAERRARFAARFPARLAPVLLPFLAREKAQGRLRADLDPVLAILSLIGMCAFPFLAHPLLGRVLGYELDEGFRARLADHSVRLFLDGARGETP